MKLTKENFEMDIPERSYDYRTWEDCFEVIDIEKFHEHRCDWGYGNKGKSLSSTKALLTKWKKAGTVPLNQNYPRNYDNMVFTYMEKEHGLDSEDYAIITGRWQIFSRWIHGDKVWPKDKMHILEEFPDAYRFLQHNQKYGYNNFQVTGFASDDNCVLHVNILHDSTRQHSDGHFSDPRCGYFREILPSLSLEQAKKDYVNISLIKRCLKRKENNNA